MRDGHTATEIMRQAYSPARFGNMKAAIYAAWKEIGLPTHRRARAIYNGEVQRLKDEEFEAIRIAAIRGLKDERERALASIKALERMEPGQGDLGL